MRFSFTTAAMVLMALLATPGNDSQRFDADFSAPAAAAMTSAVADSPASVNG